jgi:hypothetical protein
MSTHAIEVAELLDRLRTMPGYVDDDHPLVKVYRNAAYHLSVLADREEGVGNKEAGKHCGCACGCGAALKDGGAHCIPIRRTLDEGDLEWLDATPGTDEPIACLMVCITCRIEHEEMNT